MEKTSPRTDVTPEAAAHVAALGMQAELDRMIEHAWQTVPDLVRLRVTLELSPDGEDDPRVVLWADVESPWQKSVRTDQEYGRWEVTTFTPDVCRHFVLLSVP